MSQREQHISTTDARQASPRKTNFRVLVGSLVLCAVAAVALYFAYMQGPVVDQPAQVPQAQQKSP